MDTKNVNEGLVKESFRLLDEGTLGKILNYSNLLCKESNTSIDVLKRNYGEVQDIIYQKFMTSGFWTSISRGLANWNHEYRIKRKFELIPPGFEPKLYKKDFASFLMKTYRKNCITAEKNCHKQQSPELKVKPFRWYSEIKDIVRTTLIARYLDGVEFIRTKLYELATQNNLTMECDLQSKQEGYYALHVCVTMDYSYPSLGLEVITAPVSVEIQVTTELQSNIKKLLHSIYESERLRPKPKNEDELWKWDYNSLEFRTNYLGHILHYLEGMIISLREEMGSDTVEK